ncbi:OLIGOPEPTIDE TRANSPORTER-RELATED [Salix viminalis]|uniref:OLIGOPEPTIDE TRANSPORTER-RELATED n=1 Tax=Salix viminalis TaxID=40686 RepID=A0A9Q0SEJ6_SALVM|nr:OLIGOPEPTIDE TRANSPORTER-RELATED [Salix viminalis]
MAILAIIERVRLRLQSGKGFRDNPDATTHMSAMWLLPFYFLLGFSEAMNGVGRNEFFYTELPKSMSSVASNLFEYWTLSRKLGSQFYSKCCSVGLLVEKIKRVGFQATSTRAIMITITGFLLLWVLLPSFIILLVARLMVLVRGGKGALLEMLGKGRLVMMMVVILV